MATRGADYVWTKAEIEKLLGPAEYRPFATAYGLNLPPNFEDGYALLQPKPLSAADVQRLKPTRDRLLAERSKRPHPLLDDKILTADNGLMIRGLADASRIFKHEPYTRRAVKAADFVLAKLRTPDGRLLRTYGRGQAKLNAYLDDYAFLVDGLIALHLRAPAMNTG